MLGGAAENGGSRPSAHACLRNPERGRRADIASCATPANFSTFNNKIKISPSARPPATSPCNHPSPDRTDVFHSVFLEAQQARHKTNMADHHANQPFGPDGTEKSTPAERDEQLTKLSAKMGAEMWNIQERARAAEDNSPARKQLTEFHEQMGARIRYVTWDTLAHLRWLHVTFMWIYTHCETLEEGSGLRHAVEAMDRRIKAQQKREEKKDHQRVR
ncbi:hypothetical protein B0T14DRAFT_199126 [Immersiella caudata]|uniref:Uncharacterized protein n=1 Tax=Immersiella caudata TaxID=314043 RepID=A0AA40BZ18_9PEZI|nr:hypothetical protein B0T14DRAFT_199126 [Immersiella caudata]